MVILEPYTPADAPEVAALISRLYPDRALSADEVRRGDRDQQEAGHRHARTVIRSSGGALVDLAWYAQPLGEYRSRSFSAALIVAPSQRAQGLGTALCGWLTDQMQAPSARAVCVRLTQGRGALFTSAAFLKMDGPGPAR